MSRKRRYVKNTLKKQLTQQQHDWLQNKYLPFLDRQGLKETSETNYLQCIRNLLTQENLKPWDLTQEDVHQLGEKIAANIQNSKYQQKNNSEMSKRRKRMHWTTFKHILKTQNLNTDQLPSFKPREKGKVQTQARDTRPEDLPNPRQVKQFVRDIGKHSGDQVKLRNQSLILLMWDKGPRIGEALQIQLKDCEIKNDQLKIFIQGNKSSSDRKVTVYQGRETIKDFIQTHPGQPTDYLFSDLKHNKLDQPVDSRKFAAKIRRVAEKTNADFKVRGEPNHIFRKAMTTAHVVNDWATWEEITQIQGKSVSGTKPTYLKMAVSDADSSIGEKIGATQKGNGDEGLDHHMKGDPLLPQKCRGCGKLNHCYKQKCEYCGGSVDTLEKSQVETGKKEKSRAESELLRQLEENPDVADKILESIKQIKNE